MSQNVDLIQRYFSALAKVDFETVGSLMADDLIWHQPGESPLSGSHKGKDRIFEHLGNFAKLSQDSFSIDNVEYITSNGNLVTASVHFKASSENDSIAMKGVDLFRVEDGRIQEVWLFSEDIKSEDDFWLNQYKKQ